MTQSRDEALAKILAEAEKLETYRADGATYFEKCDNLVVRIKSVFSDIEPKDLSETEISTIKAVKDIIATEEIFAQSSMTLRDPKKWLGSLDG